MRSVATVCRPSGAIILAGLVLSSLAPARGQTVYREIEFTTGSTIRGVVTWDGKLPDVEEFTVYVDTNSCARSGSKPNDRVAIDPLTKGVKDTVVYLDELRSGIPFDEAKEVFWPHQLKIAGCSFVQHVLPGAVGRRIRIVNDDPVVHILRVVAPDQSSQILELALQGGETFLPIHKTGFYYITCRRHPWESAVIAAMDHPYYAITDETGSFVIEKVPAGTYTLVAWHDSVRVHKIVRGGMITGYSFPPGFSVSQPVELEEGEELKVDISLREPE